MINFWLIFVLIYYIDLLLDVFILSNIDTPIEQYMDETPEAAYFEKMEIEDIIIYENDDEENEEEVRRRKKRVRA